MYGLPYRGFESHPLRFCVVGEGFRSRAGPQVSAPRPNRAGASQAARHASVREAHSAETAEDYVEAIEAVSREKGTCRVADLVRVFGVSHVTVSRTVGRLVRDGFATTEPYQPIELTAKGQSLARSSRRRHEVVVRFLIALGLDAATAELDAEGIEHHVSPRTLRVFEQFTKEHE